MSKRRKPAEPELPLFDLPLQGGDGPDSLPLEMDPEPVPAAPKTPKRKSSRRRTAKSSAAPQPAAPQPAAPQSVAPQPAAPQSVAPQSAAPQSVAPQPAAPLLFSEEELAGAQIAHSVPTTDDEPEVLSADEELPLIQDRLLGGLADVTIHLATLGSMIVAVQLMGVPVALADWPAFAGLTLIFSFLYSVVPLAFWGHTPGMAWVGHSARSESDEPLSFPQTAMRWLGSLFTVLLLGLPLLLGLSGRSLADRVSDSKTLQL